jgi:hypothetical protein
MNKFLESNHGTRSCQPATITTTPSINTVHNKQFEEIFFATFRVLQCLPILET